MTFLLEFWKPIALVLLVAALAVAAIVAKHSYDEGMRNEGRAEVRAEWAKETAVKNKAIADQATAWDIQRQKTETAENERDAARQKLFAAIAPLPAAVAGQRVPGAFVVHLDAGRRAAAASGTPAEPDQATHPASAGPDVANAGAESDLGLIASWVDQVLQIHAECRDRVAAWLSFYRGLQAAQPKGATP